MMCVGMSLFFSNSIFWAFFCTKSERKKICQRKFTVKWGLQKRFIFFFFFLQPTSSPAEDEASFKKGLLWQQRDKLFSRWKERYFILTKDYFHCFKKAGTSRITEMGGFIFKVNLKLIRTLFQIIIHFSIIPAETDGSGQHRVTRQTRLFDGLHYTLQRWKDLLEETWRDSRMVHGTSGKLLLAWDMRLTILGLD